MKKLSIVRFKPKPGKKDEFVAGILDFNKERMTASARTFYLMDYGDEVIAVAIRDPDNFAEDVSKGVEWLDQHRHLLEEYNAEDRHTIPMPGDLIG